MRTACHWCSCFPAFRPLTVSTRVVIYTQSIFKVTVRQLNKKDEGENQGCEGKKKKNTTKQFVIRLEADESHSGKFPRQIYKLRP